MTKLKACVDQHIFWSDVPASVVEILKGKIPLQTYLAEYYRPNCVAEDNWKDLIKEHKDDPQLVLQEYPAFIPISYCWLTIEEAAKLVTADIKLIVSHIIEDA
jgi:hypothetical protein